MNGTRHREVGEYLRRLQRSMGDLPAERREEILAEIEEHIAEDLAENPAATDADVRNLLERVGDRGYRSRSPRALRDQPCHPVPNQGELD